MRPRTLPRDGLYTLAQHLVSEAQQREADEWQRVDQLLFSDADASDEEVDDLRSKRMLTVIVSNIGAALLEFLQAHRSPEIPLEAITPVVDQAIEHSYDYLGKCRGEGHENDEEFTKSRNLAVAYWKEMLDRLLTEQADRRWGRGPKPL